MSDEPSERPADPGYQVHCETFAALGSAASLIELFGGDVPTFHDAILEAIHLSNIEGSTLRIRCSYPTIFDGQKLVVTLHLDEIIDLDLDYFGLDASILFSLLMRPAKPNPERSRYYPRHVEDGDIEIEFEPSYGIGGTIIAKGISVTWAKAASPGS